MLVVLSIVLCILVTGIGIWRVYATKHKINNQNIIDFFKVGVSLAVSVIPEGYVSRIFLGNFF